MLKIKTAICRFFVVIFVFIEFLGGKIGGIKVKKQKRLNDISLLRWCGWGGSASQTALLLIFEENLQKVSPLSLSVPFSLKCKHFGNPVCREFDQKFVK